MTTRVKSEVLIARDEIVAAPAESACTDQSFELPSGLYIAMAALFAGFVGVLSLSFRGGHMAVVYGVIFAFIAALLCRSGNVPGYGARSQEGPQLGDVPDARNPHRDRPLERGGGDRPRPASAVPDLLLRHGNCRNRDDRQLTH